MYLCSHCHQSSVLWYTQEKTLALETESRKSQCGVKLHTMNQAQIPQFPRGNISRSSLFTQHQENDGEGYDVEHHQR